MGSISLWHGDICDLEVDAIVNAASSSLWMATGVAGAIKRRGGDEIEFEAVRQAPCPLGSAIVTGAGELPCQYVIHAVSLGPDRRASAESIESATRAALAEAERLGLRSIAFPALGTGVGGFPLEEAADVMVQTVREEITRRPSIQEVIFALKGQAPYVAFEAVLSAAQPVPATAGPSERPGGADDPSETPGGLGSSETPGRRGATTPGGRGATSERPTGKAAGAGPESTSRMGTSGGATHPGKRQGTRRGMTARAGGARR